MSRNVKRLSRVDISDFNIVSHHLLRLVEQSASGTTKLYVFMPPYVPSPLIASYSLADNSGVFAGWNSVPSSHRLRFA